MTSTDQDPGDQDPGEVQDMGQLLDSVEPMKPLRRGDVIDGIVMRSDQEGILLNIGHKAEGMVPPGEMKSLNKESLEQLKVGDEVVALVVKGESAEGGALLSIDRAVGEVGWRNLGKALDSGEHVDGKVLGFNRGGAIVEVEGVQAFVPMSQLVSVSRDNFRVARAEPQAAGSDGDGKTAGEGESDGDGETVGERESDGDGETVGERESDGDGKTDGEGESDGGGKTVGEGESDGDGKTAGDGGSDSDGKTDGEGESDGDGKTVGGVESDGDGKTAGEGESDGDGKTVDERESDGDGKTVDERESDGDGKTGGEGDGSTEESQDIGKELELKVLEVNRGRNRAILSERRAIQENREERKGRLIQELSEGEVRSGKVTGISSFGAFVDLGGADGLVHISELSWSTVRSPDEVVTLGEEVEVYVLRVDAENKKIALSIKRLQPEPWETINDRYQVGDIVDATVTKLTDFGAFARVEDSVEGLIHISELTHRMIGHPREMVREGDAVRLKILRIEPERRRLGLSMKQAEEEES